MRPEVAEGKGLADAVWDRRRWGVAVAGVAAAALVVKLLLALKTFGSNDVYAYERFSIWSEHLRVGVYQAAWDFNHPALMIHVLRLMGWLSRTSGLWFPFWLRLPAILADAASVWLVWRILEARLAERSIRWAVLLLAGSPILILVSGFHGNTDSVMIFFLLLAVYLIGRGLPGWAGGAAFGMAMSIKVVPILVAPVLFFFLPNKRSRLLFVVGAAAVVALRWSPYLVQNPMAIARQVFGYRSLYGHWGLSQIGFWLASAAPQWSWLNDLFRQSGTYVQLAVILAGSWWINRGESRPALYKQVGLVICFFLATSTGFGVQYLCWLCPWVVGLGAIPAGVYYLTGGAFLFAVYDYWAQGLPWFLADSNRVGDYQGHADYLQILCWLTVVMLAWVAWRDLRGDRPEAPEWWAWLWTGNRRLAAVVAALVLVVYPTAKVASGADIRPENHVANQDALLAIRAEEYMGLSAYLHQAQRFTEEIAVTQKALALFPNSAEIHNSLSASYASAHQWDDALREAREALRLNPGFQPARLSLLWALQGKGDGAAASAATVPAGLTAADYLRMSVEHYQAGRFAESIESAREASKLQPDMAEAYNNMAAGYASLRQWDAAIDAAQQALRVRPDFELARNNLLWALAQKHSGGRR